MRKVLFSILALLLMAGVANAASIPVASDPQNAPEIWIMSVYSTDTVSITSGSAVIWAMASDTTDTSYAYRTMWIDQTTTTDDIRSAGIVVSDSIAASGQGEICIYGPVLARCADSSDAVTANEAVGTSSVEGQLGGADAADNKALMGWCIYASPISVDYGGIYSKDGTDNSMLAVFVNPTPMVN